MKKWMMAAMLFGGLSMMTSCTEEKDNAVVNPLPTPEVNAERQVFEEQFSKQLAAMAEQLRFESAIESTQSLQEFVTLLDENSLKEQVISFLAKVVQGGTFMEISKMADAEKADALACLKSRFELSEEEATKWGFIIIDASKGLGKLHLTFKDGKCEMTQDGEGFTVESHKQNGDVLKGVITFSNESNGVCFFATRVAGVTPLAMQLPKSIGVSLTTPKGKILNGTIELTTTAATRYMDFSKDNWTASAKLTANVNNREETLTVYANHTDQQAYDGKVAISFGQQEILSLAVNGVKHPYSDEYLQSDELKQLREMGIGYAAAYEVIKTIKGKSADNVELTVGGDLSFKGSVNDIAKVALALGGVAKLHNQQPTFEAMNAKVQEINKYISVTASQKSTGISASASLVTYMKGSEYQPAVALTFNGETQPKAMLESMSEADYANYTKIVGQVNTLIKECSTLVEVAAAKGKVIGEAFKL